MEQSVLCLPSFSLSLKILPFSLSNGTTQISSDASCDIAHLWWHGLLTSLVQYNMLTSYKEQSSIKSNVKVNSTNTLGYFSLKRKPSIFLKFKPVSFINIKGDYSKL